MLRNHNFDPYLQFLFRIVLIKYKVKLYKIIKLWKKIYFIFICQKGGASFWYNKLSPTLSNSWTSVPWFEHSISSWSSPLQSESEKRLFWLLPKIIMHQVVFERGTNSEHVLRSFWLLISRATGFLTSV